MAIRKCDCVDKATNKFQDKTYGVGMRVMNRCGSKEHVKYRCTNCGKTLDPTEGNKK